MWKCLCLFLLAINISLSLFIYSKLDLSVRPPSPINSSTIELTTPKGKIVAEVPNTEYKYALGLAERDSLSLNQGMLFRFKSAGNQPMWMKDMRFPIDILWLDKNKKVIYIKANISPDTYKYAEAISYFSPEPNAYYVLELSAGNAEHLGITVGTRLAF